MKGELVHLIQRSVWSSVEFFTEVACGYASMVL